MTSQEHFDQAYYQKFYGDEDTRVTSPDEIQLLCNFVHSYLEFLDLSPVTVLDLGCGLGWWRTALLNLDNEIEYTGVEISQHLCQQFGWEQGSIVDYRSDHPFDLVICQGVLQYLPDDQARQALENLNRLTNQALYIEALTCRDWEENVDRETTDGAVHKREGRWYRNHLSPTFFNCGGGLFAKKDSHVSLLELEHLE